MTRVKIEKMLSFFFVVILHPTTFITFYKYKRFTMIPFRTYVLNLILCARFKNIKGSIVECGVWRGGMSAGMVSVFGKNREYYLFDSFEGLPAAKEVDGASAIDWQNNKTSNSYFDNCKAEESFAETCMKNSGAKNVHLVKGWFSETLPTAKINESIAILRLDGDWYESTMDCMTNLYPQVIKGGLIILDDYNVWDGCARATHDYLSQNNLDVRIYQFKDSTIHFIIKK